MKIIGIVGKSGSGKTTFSAALAKKLNCMHIDFDILAHQALLDFDVVKKLREKLGDEICDANHQIDRKKLGNLVFTDKSKMNELTNITWEYMQNTVDAILKDKPEVIVLDAILLPKCKYWKQCDVKVLVNAKDSMRKSMVLQRDHITEEYFDKRDSASIDYSPYQFDYQFENDYTEASFGSAISHIQQILQKEDKMM